MSYLKVYKSYCEKLVTCLPMDDTLFFTKLYGKQLLPGDTENKLKSLPTPAEKASYFLSHVIKPALEIDDTSGFTTLLSVMEECGYGHVQALSHKINDELAKKGRKSDI